MFFNVASLFLLGFTVTASYIDAVWEQEIAKVPDTDFGFTFYSSVNKVDQLCGSDQMWHCQDVGGDPNRPPNGAERAMVSLGGSGGTSWSQLNGTELGEKLTKTGYVGVNLDWETDLSATVGDHIVSEMANMRAAFPELYIIMTIFGSYADSFHKTEWDTAIKMEKAGNLDYLGLMMFGNSMTSPGWGVSATASWINKAVDHANENRFPLSKLLLALTTTDCSDAFVQVFADAIDVSNLGGSMWWQGEGLPSQKWLDTLGGHGQVPPPVPSVTPTLAGTSQSITSLVAFAAGGAVIGSLVAVAKFMVRAAPEGSVALLG